MPFAEVVSQPRDPKLFEVVQFELTTCLNSELLLIFHKVQEIFRMGNAYVFGIVVNVVWLGDTNN